MQHRRPPPPPDDALVVEDVAAPVPPARSRDTFWTVKRVRSIAYGCFVGAAAIALAVGFQSYQFANRVDADQQRTEQRLVELEEYVAERRAELAEEQANRDEQFRDYLCRVLAQFPAGVPALDQARVTLGCQEPGAVPAAESRATAPPAAPPGSPSPDAPAPSTRPPVGAGQPAPPAPPSGTETPSPAPAPGPAPSAPPAAPPAPSAPPENPGALCGLLPLLCPLGL